MKVKQIISEVVNDLQALGVDDRIPIRFVLTKLIGFNALFLRREEILRLYKYDNIFTPIECIRMIESDISECANVQKIHRYMRSEKKLPELYTCTSGNIIKEVISLDDGNIYYPSSTRDYSNIMNREFKSKKKYYWFRDGYLIIPEGPELVSLLGCFIDTSKARSVSENYMYKCEEPLEEEFPCPSHLLSIVRQECVKDLFNFYKRIVPDEIPDLDNNTKTQR